MFNSLEVRCSGFKITARTAMDSGETQAGGGIEGGRTPAGGDGCTPYWAAGTLHLKNIRPTKAFNLPKGTVNQEGVVPKSLGLCRIHLG